ncbi:MAG: DNA repair protein RecO [Deltaproteobacteria bacterium]|nr:DNA repair protein RecO [Deltaproteobacteria bacterium]
MTEAFSDLALVTGLVPFGDADWVVHFFTQRHGRLGAFAKGARRSKRRFAGLQPLLLAQVELRPRRGALLALDKVEPERHPLSNVTDPVVLGRAAYLTELTTRMVPEEAPDEEVFFRLVNAIDALATKDTQPEILRAYELQLLQASGELLDLSRVAPCVAFDAREGVLLAEPLSGSIPFSEAARSLALLLVQADFVSLESHSHARLREVGRLFASYLRRADLPRLKSLQYLKDLQRDLTH